MPPYRLKITLQCTLCVGITWCVYKNENSRLYPGLNGLECVEVDGGWGDGSVIKALVWLKHEELHLGPQNPQKTARSGYSHARKWCTQGVWELGNGARRGYGN